VNIATIARFLGSLGIDLCEARCVPDVEDEIVAAINALRARYTYVFTTGGIGPTHDDITADAIAKAFGLAVEHHPEAMAMLAARYAPGDFNERRQRMARVPQGASLIRNSVSVAPGFQIENVFVMAGVPKIMQAMLEDIEPRLARGVLVKSRSYTVRLPEGRMPPLWRKSSSATPRSASAATVLRARRTAAKPRHIPGHDPHRGAGMRWRSMRPAPKSKAWCAPSEPSWNPQPDILGKCSRALEIQNYLDVSVG
jgi:molybdopterin-biosynthesis enzyme MoeA-like protein